MPNPFSEFVGHGATLLAMGRAARQASIAAGGDAGAREGRGSATAHAWPVPLLATVARQPTLDGGADGGFFRVAKAPSQAAQREAGRKRAVEKQARAAAPVAMRRAREEVEAEGRCTTEQQQCGR